MKRWYPAPGLPLGLNIMGADYHGWQAQPHLGVATVQETLELALSSVAGERLPPPAPVGPIPAFTGTRRLFTLMTPQDGASRLGFWARIDICQIMSECTGRHP